MPVVGQIVTVNISRPDWPPVLRPGVVLSVAGNGAPTVQVWVSPADDDLVRQLGGDWGPSYWIGFGLTQGAGSGEWQP